MLLLRLLVVSAATVGEVAGTPQRIPIIDLNAAGVVDRFAVSAHARQLPVDSWHERILPREEGQDRPIQEAEFVMESIDKKWPAIHLICLRSSSR